MSEAIYRKVVRGKKVKYELIGNSQSYYDAHEVIRAGQFRLEFISGDGMHRYAYPVTPDTAGWEAAALIARGAMEQAIQQASQFKPMGVKAYTKKQLKVLDECRKKMEECGALLPSHWVGATSSDIASAAIDAVKSYKP